MLSGISSNKVVPSKIVDHEYLYSISRHRIASLSFLYLRDFLTISIPTSTSSNECFTPSVWLSQSQGSFMTLMINERPLESKMRDEALIGADTRRIYLLGRTHLCNIELYIIIESFLLLVLVNEDCLLGPVSTHPTALGSPEALTHLPCSLLDVSMAHAHQPICFLCNLNSRFRSIKY